MLNLLDRTSGFLTQLKDKPGISIMAECGFTIKEMFQAIGVELNIPPFMKKCNWARTSNLVEYM